MRARRLIESSSYGPEELRVIWQAFDQAWETVAPLLDRASPLRTAHLRDPVGPQIQFASESFIDEIAAAVSADPVAFRLRYLKAPRDRFVYFYDEASPASRNTMPKTIPTLPVFAAAAMPAKLTVPVKP